MKYSSVVLVIGAMLIGNFAYANGVANGGPFYGGITQTLIVCYGLNRSGPSQMINHFIFDQFGTKVPLTADLCGYSVIQPYASCSFAAAIRNDRAYTCVIQASGLQGFIPDVGGTVEILDANGHVLSHAEMR